MQESGPDKTASLLAPAAICTLDLAAPLPDLSLTPGRFGEPYRSLLAVARLDGEVVGTATLPVDLSGNVTRDRLARQIAAKPCRSLGCHSRVHSHGWGFRAVALIGGAAPPRVTAAR